MWRRIAYLITFAGLLPVTGASAQVGPVRLPSRTLLSEQENVRFEVVMGRIHVRTVQLGTKRRLDERHEEGELHESLMVVLGELATTLRYELSEPRQRLTLDVSQGAYVTLEHEYGVPTAQEGASEAAQEGGSGGQAGASVSIRFRQAPRGPLTLAVTDSSGTRHFSAPSLWHLLLSQEAACREYLLPALAVAHPHWDLARQLQEVRRELVAAASRPTLPPRDLLLEWISALSSRSFRERQDALLKLHRVGQPLLAFLESLDERQLDCEQRRRMKSLKLALQETDVDTPERIASRLIADRQIWCEMLASSDETTRHLAAHHLSVLCGQPIRFSPEAVLETRQAQLADLRQTIVR